METNVLEHTPEVALSDDDPYYRKNPSLDDQVHCLITVVAADKVALMKDETVKTLKDIRLAARDLGIPQICILTRIDVACPLVAEDLKAVYTSKYIKEQMMGLNAKIGIPMNCIVPVKNYHEEIDLNNDVDMLLLRALTHIVNFADDHVRNLHCKNENI
ncbi:hypothetical protein JZ751_010000 [Albula glossodonta]|uniref:Interferon-induced protein 44-like n=1 Tax=Albula glossodonta TaxID=121402 RepID=A0A8T2N335_9TELE|nr:hypothetical protein JZ751_010000 [Albula glossodonta]